jgi:hypothetical protein
MAIPYDSFPTQEVWETDSAAPGWGYSTWRMSDPTLGIIDELVRRYNDPNEVAVQIDILFYLFQATNFWLNKLNKDSDNTGEPIQGLTGARLPVAKKVVGSVDRRSAMSALKTITGELLAAHTHHDTAAASVTSLELVYGKASHGVGLHVGSDAHQIAQIQGIGEVAIFLQQAHLQRRYKLRFRDGVAWRWDANAGENAIFDTRNNSESESLDQLTHFVMNTRGHIFAGFDKTAMWFKHSSLIGGANAYSAGRIKIVAGRVVEVVNDSGHYAPTVLQMRNLLFRLKLYGCNVDAINVRRIHPAPIGSFPGANILRSGASWPDGVV